MPATILNNTVLLTSDGLKSLEQELSELNKVKIPAVVERLSKAREDGDLSENSAYQTANEELEFLQGRASEIEEILKNSRLVETATKKGTIDIGSKVTILLNGKKETFSVVGEWEADPVAKKISASSPLGKALVGKKVGEKTEVAAPAGKIVYSIVAVE